MALASGIMNTPEMTAPVERMTKEVRIHPIGTKMEAVKFLMMLVMMQPMIKLQTTL